MVNLLLGWVVVSVPCALVVGAWIGRGNPRDIDAPAATSRPTLVGVDAEA